MENILNKLVYITGFLGPVITIPQVLEIWVNKNAEGVSLIMWTGYLLVASTWFAYGFVHKQKPLIYIYSAWILIDTIILLGLIKL